MRLKGLSLRDTQAVLHRDAVPWNRSLKVGLLITALHRGQLLYSAQTVDGQTWRERVPAMCLRFLPLCSQSGILGNLTGNPRETFRTLALLRFRVKEK